MGCLRSPYDPSLIYRYIQCIYGFIGREITRLTVMFTVNVLLWPTLHTGGTSPRSAIFSVSLQKSRPFKMTEMKRRWLISSNFMSVVGDGPSMPPKLPHKTPRGTNSLILPISSHSVIRRTARKQRDRERRLQQQQRKASGFLGCGRVATPSLPFYIYMRTHSLVHTFTRATASGYRLGSGYRTGSRCV